MARISRPFSVPVSRIGFSLVEVTIALGIVAFVLVAILGILPVGLRQASDSENETRAINILSAIAADRISSPTNSNSVIFQIPPLPALGSAVSSNSFAVSEAGAFLGSQFDKAAYRVSWVMRPPSAGRFEPWQISYRMTWPAGQTNSLNAVETLTSIEQ